MGSQKIARRHHTVPKVLLRGFAQDGLIPVRRRSAKVRDVSLNSVTVWKDFYNFRNSAGVMVGSIEQWLANHVEGPAADVLDRLHSGEQPADDDSAVLAAFVSAQLLRTPSSVDLLDQIDDQLKPVLALSALNAAGTIDILNTSGREQQWLMAVVRRAMKQHVSPAENRKSQLRTLLRKADELTGELTGWSWKVLRSEKPALVVGDAPVVVIRTGKNWGGILPAGSPAYLPLSPHRLLVGEKHSLTDEQQLPEELAVAVNAATCYSAFEAIMTRPGLAWPSDVQLPTTRPRLSAPHITWSKSEGGPSTFPAAHPTPSSPHVRDLLVDLGAVDTVE